MINFKKGDKYLITTDNWFVAPDGQQYKSVFGVFKGVFDDSETLGVKTNRGSTNWYVQIGDMTIAGCQIFYVIKTNQDNLNFNPRDRDEQIIIPLEKGEKIINKKHVTSLIYNAGD